MQLQLCECTQLADAFVECGERVATESEGANGTARLPRSLGRLTLVPLGWLVLKQVPQLGRQLSERWLTPSETNASWSAIVTRTMRTSAAEDIDYRSLSLSITFMIGRIGRAARLFCTPSGRRFRGARHHAVARERARAQ